ncbi:hypothetical protein JD844_019778 [Phrynosoma platyrhinos]|uniref:VWFD domain-containing protein n=1 Tax=Phrynosoma platyrhinos TaxID=52577 RepID=A0ABQ7TQB3_PHRPL|nr:hypothetical protein JD844_019778 [Phrynosoma platyrhinos]
MPNGQPTLYMTNLTNYLIEEKLMKPLHSLYNTNLIMEYYRFKRAMMESPFEHHALLIGYRHLRTFDGRLYSLTSKCSILLAQDFAHNAFTIVLNLNSGHGNSLYVNMDGTAIVIYPEHKLLPFLCFLGASAGLFGTNDNEAGNEWMLPDHSYEDSLQEFIHAWQVSQQGKC